MTFTSKIVKALFLCALLTATAACTAAPKKIDTYTSGSGAVMTLENDAESCKRSCDNDFDRCSDTSAAQAQVGRGQMTGVFGAGADCKDDMKACLARCKGR
jgi:hypothetical protein